MIKVLVQISLCFVIILFVNSAVAQDDSIEYDISEESTYDFSNEKISDYFIPDKKFNTVFFFQPKSSGEVPNISRKIQYIKTSSNRYKIVDQQFYKNSLLTKKEYSIIVTDTYIVAKYISDYSSVTKSETNYDYGKFADTLLRFPNSEDDYWNMSNGSKSMYTCKLTPIYVVVNGEKQKALKMSKEEYFRDENMVPFGEREYFNLYYVKGIGLYFVEIRNMNIIYSTGKEDVYPFDKFEKMTFDSDLGMIAQSIKDKYSSEKKETEKLPTVIACNKELASLEKKHSIIYKELYNSLDAKNKAILKQSQLVWIKGKEKKCLSEQQKYDNGSMAGVVFCDCSVIEVKLRMENLKKRTY